MAKYIAHASGGESASVRIKGGKAGDQTKKEVCIRTWYDFSCNMVIRFVDVALAAMIGNLMMAIARNNNIGYDQSCRNTLLTQAEKVGFVIEKIKTACECDCSSAVTVSILGAIYRVYGEEAYKKAKKVLVINGNCASTRTLKARCQKLNHSVKIYTTSVYTRSTAKAKFGDIYLKEGKHVVAYIADCKEVDAGVYAAGNNYTLKANLNVRHGAGLDHPRKMKNELTAGGQKHATNSKYGVLKKGTIVTCKAVIKEGNNIWLEIPSGYVCAKQGDKVWIV